MALPDASRQASRPVFCAARVPLEFRLILLELRLICVADSRPGSTRTRPACAHPAPGPTEPAFPNVKKNAV